MPEGRRPKRHLAAKRDLMACQGETAGGAVWRLRRATALPVNGGTVSYRGHGGHREQAFPIPDWRAHMPRRAWRCPMINFSKNSAGIPTRYPAASRRSADGPRIAPDRLRYNHTAKALHNFDETVENDSRLTGKLQRIQARASSAGIVKEHRQACVPGDGASSSLADVKKQV